MRAPSAFFFVCIVFVYGMAAILEYRINRLDHHQYLSILAGFGTGISILASSIRSSEGKPRMLSTICLCISVAMMISALVHVIWRTIVCTRQTRVRRKLNEWLQASTLDTNKHQAVRCYEII
jgi:hypothetical protein